MKAIDILTENSEGKKKLEFQLYSYTKIYSHRYFLMGRYTAAKINVTMVLENAEQKTKDKKTLVNRKFLNVNKGRMSMKMDVTTEAIVYTYFRVLVQPRCLVFHDALWSKTALSCGNST